ncbi:hypothetical protein IC621_07585 [Bacillus sp. IB182487]|uniref:SCP domain-containing protein n=2 Tax=Metabacillus arenae TaxID=2771434 RepID=A0A926RWN1_9BACI|nr:hypothetical protein [Metabacillus arenae]
MNQNQQNGQVPNNFLQGDIQQRIPGQQEPETQMPAPDQAPDQLPDGQPDQTPDQGQGQLPNQQPGQGQAPEQGQGQEQQPNEGQNMDAAEKQVIDLTNAERKKNGLSPLSADNSLANVAQKKSDDMKKNNYFSHNSPTHGSPFEMMQNHGEDYQTAGENIAQGQQSPEEVVDAWMKSQGHRENILNGDFTHIGIGYTQDGHYWTQMFIGK